LENEYVLAENFLAMMAKPKEKIGTMNTVDKRNSKTWGILLALALVVAACLSEAGH
jgi:hypothetical protein